MPEPIDRRKSDNAWRKHVDSRLDDGTRRIDSLASDLKQLRETVDARLSEGAARFDSFARVQQGSASELKLNTDKTLEINDKLDAHVEQYQIFTAKLHPFLDVVETMQPGVIVLGQIGTAAKWLARKVRQIVVFVAPIAAAIYSIYYYVTTGHPPPPK